MLEHGADLGFARYIIAYNYGPISYDLLAVRLTVDQSAHLLVGSFHTCLKAITGHGHVSKWLSKIAMLAISIFVGRLLAKYIVLLISDPSKALLLGLPYADPAGIHRLGVMHLILCEERSMKILTLRSGATAARYFRLV